MRRLSRGVLAALRRFPEKGLVIGRIARSDSIFRSLCEDLHDAEEALERWSRVLSDREQSALRRSEYRILVEELADEIEGIVDGRPRSLG